MNAGFYQQEQNHHDGKPPDIRLESGKKIEQTVGKNGENKGGNVRLL